MENVLSRIKCNEFYIFYRREGKREDITAQGLPRYAIYYTKTYGGGISKEFNFKKDAVKYFNQATKEAEKHAYLLF